MAMVIKNNMSSLNSLNILNRNGGELGKAMQSLSSGFRINGAGDGAAEYSIAKRMDVKIRGLMQDSENVQKGGSLLHVAEGGIQNQLDIMRTIKERVINACNDTNTDEDRQIIEKEINQFYEQIEDIAVSTDYNGKRLLYGCTSVKSDLYSISGYDLLEELHLIPANYHGLDGIDKDFDIFSEYSVSPAAIPALGLPGEASAIPYTGGYYGDPSVSNFSLTDSAMGVSFASFKAGIAAGKTYGLLIRTGEWKDYYYFSNRAADASDVDVNYIAAGNFNSWDDVAKSIARYTERAVYSKDGAGNAQLTLTADDRKWSYVMNSISGVDRIYRSAITTVRGIDCGTRHLSGGVDAYQSKDADDDPDTAGVAASVTVQGGGTAGTGFVVRSSSANGMKVTDYYVRFVDGAKSNVFEHMGGKAERILPCGGISAPVFRDTALKTGQ